MMCFGFLVIAGIFAWLFLPLGVALPSLSGDSGDVEMGAGASTADHLQNVMNVYPCAPQVADITSTDIETASQLLELSGGDANRAVEYFISGKWKAKLNGVMNRTSGSDAAKTDREPLLSIPSAGAGAGYHGNFDAYECAYDPIHACR
ncbi:hypothetical protein CYMTET_55460 [Cymbomonas tetramitiformis]|uniref:CUE domain-containing protein n=1 Tax=Cymbomonas tetramitiformis TaxID=36881 RepID=A0AAE0ENJ9_9CHLO|nr:hypothetical protein CYMTET_55460 [Cymbomonas tetramitiformis]